MANIRQEIQFEGLKSRFVQAIEEKVQGTTVDVLVLGPRTDGARLRGAGRLRKAILNRCSEFGARVIAVAAEHRELIREAKRVLRKRYNLCTYEHELAKQCDLIVILPASAGSLVELGLFALEDWACSKSAIFFDARHKKSRSFISEGPRRAYKMRGARINDVDYDEIEKVLARVRNIIQEFRLIKVEKKGFT